MDICAGICQCSALPRMKACVVAAAIATEGIAAVGVTGWAVDYVRLNGNFARRIRRLRASDTDRRSILLSRHAHRPRDGGAPRRNSSRPTLRADRHSGPASEYSVSVVCGWNGGHPEPIFRGSICRNTCSIAGERNRSRNTPTPLTRHGRARQATVVAGNFRCSRLGHFCCAARLSPPVPSLAVCKGPLAELPALRDTMLIAPACHDTASAIAGIHAHGDDWAYISSGTWSLVGTLLDQPCAGPESARLNFTNEGGVGGTICFLRNVNGLWLQDQCMEAWKSDGEHRTVEELIEAAATLPSPQALIDVDDPQLIAPGRMPERIAMQLENAGVSAKPFLRSPPAMINLILHSLAARYAAVLHQIEALTAKKSQTALYCRRRQPKSFIEPPHTTSDSIGTGVRSTRELHPRQCIHPTGCLWKSCNSTRQASIVRTWNQQGVDREAVSSLGRNACGCASDGNRRPDNPIVPSITGAVAPIRGKLL